MSKYILIILLFLTIFTTEKYNTIQTMSFSYVIRKCM